MKKNLPKVLMLGWEFPPVINGGLGIACHDLSVAMSKLADITMIIPKSNSDFKIKNLNLIGLNNITISSFVNYSHYSKQLPFGLHSIPANLNPYYAESSAAKNLISSLEGKSFFNSFDIDNLYGGNVMEKVIQFADCAAALSSKIKFDIIHAHDWMTMIAGIKIKQQSGKPLVVHIHSLEVDRSGENSRGRVYELEKKGMEEADLLLPVSNFTAENIQKHYGIAKEKIAVVHNGSPLVKPCKNKRRFREKVVLFVGRLTRQKGPERFLDIAAKVLKKNPDVRFVMAGTGDYFKKLLEKSSHKNIGNRFHLTGFLNAEKLQYLLSISDVYCMPSLSEPFGLSAVEAAQFKIPCVISKQSGVAEVLNGSLKFDFWDANKAADCILNLLKDPVLREKIINDALKNLDKITWELSAKKVIDAYVSRNLFKHNLN